MKHLLYSLFFIILIDLTFQRCANPGRPTGGPKDTIPPTLINSAPLNGTINYKEKTLVLEFSEYINADKLKQQLIITPSTDINYKSIAKRNKLEIKLESDLKDSTTYNFNIANGVTDITEKNPAVNLSIALSTGPYIDSMSVQGSVEYLMNKEAGSQFVVGLYPISDTLDILAEKPMYFTTANDSGKYQINYIKTGNYKIISFQDDNGNFLLDPETEPHGFLADTIQLDSATQLPVIRCVLQNIKPLSLINTRSVGGYVEIKFNKRIESFEIEPYIPFNIIGDVNDVVRLYKPKQINFEDSITSIVQAIDSINNSIKDTIKYVFIKSNRKPSGFSYSIKQRNIQLTDTNRININFNKPIDTFYRDKISIQSDSTFYQNITTQSYWNYNKTELELLINLTENYYDSLIIALTPTDTLESDSSSTSKSSPEIQFVIEKGTFISVESDTAKRNSLEIKKSVIKPRGELNVVLNTDHKKFIFQLLDSNDDVSHQIKDSKEFSIKTIKPGKYKIRILIDSNNDGTWSYGNLFQNIEPEEVYIYQEQTSIRENWVVELDISF
ncbi:Ig-like domain-containing domain [Ekhidna sp.]